MAWVVFYAAYSVLGFSRKSIRQDVLSFFKTWIWESLAVSLVVTGLAAISFLLGPSVGRRNYFALAVVCSLEFLMVLGFFAAFFGV